MTSTAIGQLFQLGYTKPLSPFASSSVSTLPYAKMYFYVSDSTFTTLQSVYQDNQLQVASSNPIMADANGNFAPVYMNPALQYDWQLKSSGGILLQSGYKINSPNPSQPAQAIKLLASTSITSSTTLTIDPDLSASIPAAGTYKAEMFLSMTANTAGATPGIKLSVEFSGTLNANAGNALAVAGSFAGVSLSAAQSVIAVNGTITGNLTGASYQNILYITGTLQVTSAGTLALYWAQNVSSASATTVIQGSALSVTQIG